MFLKLLTSGQREVEFFATVDVIQLRTQLNLVVDEFVVIPRDPAVRFWRSRIEGTTAYWDTSIDGVTYVQHWELPGFLTGPNATIAFGAGSSEAGSSGVTFARFESIRATGP